VFWDDRSFEIFGQKKGTSPIVSYEQWYNCLHPEDADEVVQALSEALEGTQDLNKIYRIVHPDGNTFFVHSYCHFIRDSQGKAERVIGVHLDVTEQKENVENLATQSSTRALLIDLASQFINVPLDKVPDAINNALAKVGTFFEVDRAYTFEYLWDEGITNNTYEWCAEGITPEIDNLQEVPLELIPHWVEMHKKGKPMDIPNTSDDSLSEGLRSILEPQGIKSLITLPMMMGKDCIGFVGFDSVKNHRHYSRIEEELLLVFAELLVSISAREKTEQDLKLFESVIKNAKDAVIVTDTSAPPKILFANQACCEMTGYEEAELVGQRTPIFFGEKTYQEILDFYIDSFAKFQSFECEMINYKKNGEEFWVNLSLNSIKDDSGEFTNWIAIGRETTQQKQQENALRNAKEEAERNSRELNEAQKVAKIGSWYLDVATNKVTWSDGLFDIYGFEKGASVPDYPEFEKLSTPESWKELTQKIDNTIRTGESYELEMEFYRKDRSKGWMWAKADAIIGSDGSVAGLRGISQDITERKRLELELTLAKERA
ncbi:MAG: PAS domain-containing protein, partial [Ekhidna sp.]|nr:PAS domain-containing protein [Ekhidna sp.]